MRRPVSARAGGLPSTGPGGGHSLDPTRLRRGHAATEHRETGRPPAGLGHIERLPGPAHGALRRTRAGRVPAIMQGRRVGPLAVPPRIEFRGRPSGLASWDSLQLDISVRVVSPRLGEAIADAAGEDVELVPATIVAAGQDLTGYSIVNATRSLQAIDLEASRYELVHGSDMILGFATGRFQAGFHGHALARTAPAVSAVPPGRSASCRRDPLLAPRGLAFWDASHLGLPASPASPHRDRRER